MALFHNFPLISEINVKFADVICGELVFTWSDFYMVKTLDFYLTFMFIWENLHWQTLILCSLQQNNTTRYYIGKDLCLTSHIWRIERRSCKRGSVKSEWGYMKNTPNRQKIQNSTSQNIKTHSPANKKPSPQTNSCQNISIKLKQTPQHTHDQINLGRLMVWNYASCFYPSWCLYYW